jgi:hypothetical protein
MPPVSDGNGLDHAEHLVLGDLECSPRPLRELRRDEAPSLRMVADVLGPGLVSLVARGLIEVRRFDTWPARWEDGSRVVGDDLLRASGRVETWSGRSADGILAANLTEAGVPYL